MISYISYIYIPKYSSCGLYITYIIGKETLLSGEHKIEGVVVAVTQCDSSEVTKFTEPIEEQPQPQCTVVINKFTYTDKDDATERLELYFTSSNTDVGGGSIVENGIKLSKGKVFITFMEGRGWLNVFSHTDCNKNEINNYELVLRKLLVNPITMTMHCHNKTSKSMTVAIL